MIKAVVTDATFEPLTLQEVKAQLRVDLDNTDEDQLYLGLIKAVRIHAEKYLRMDLCQKTYDIYFDGFKSTMQIETYPISSVTSIKYYDNDDTLQTLDVADYRTDLVSEIARIEIVKMPATKDKYNSVVIRAVCGYATQKAVPENIKSGMLLLIAHLDTNREAASEKTLTEIPFGVKALWDMERKFQYK
jgi:uncharacterized phiE125 gp8 family phage protein